MRKKLEISLLDYYAAAALSGLLAHPDTTGASPEHLANSALEHAQALVLARDELAEKEDDAE